MEIDQRVSEVNWQQFRSYQELTEHLIRPYSSENEKFYSIYKWVTSNISYDVDSFRQNHFPVEKTYPDYVFRQRLAVCSGYSQLLSAMAAHAGLEIKLIEGRAYDPSGSLNAIVAGDNGHAWNIVKINGYWYQADSTWDAGYVDEDVTRFERNTDKFKYYLADPVKFNVTHNATIPNMNLLNNVEMNQIDLIWHNLLGGKSLFDVVLF
jgi:transglutaminase/protease-like cytokinesis protein 3